MTKKQVIKGAILLIEKIAKDKGLIVVNNGTGHAFDHTLWKEIMKDDSGVPNVKAKGEGYSIELRSFWGSPEIDVRRIGKFGEELLIFNYSDSEKMEGDTEYKHTGCFLVQQVRVEAKWDYKACIKEVYDMIELLEVFARKEEIE